MKILVNVFYAFRLLSGGTLELWQRKAVHVRSRTVLENMEDKNAEKNVDN